jgi:VRR-NUC domain
MKYKESTLQQSCVTWFRYSFPKYSLLLFAIPNGGARTLRTGAILKREGVIPGIPDLFLAVPKLHYGGLWIEMKAGKGKLSPLQKDMIKRLEINYKVAVCYSVDEFMNVVNDYLL